VAKSCGSGYLRQDDQHVLQSDPSGAWNSTQTDLIMGKAAQCLVRRVVAGFADNLCCGLRTFASGPLWQERAVMFAAHSAPGKLGG